MSFPSLMRAASLIGLAALLPACAQDTAGPLRQEAGVPLQRDLLTVAWQAQARSLVAAGRLSPLAAGRVYAALSVAQYHAVQAVDDAAYNDDNEGRSHAEARRGAVAGASARVLGFVFASAASSLDALAADQGAGGPGQTHPAFTRGMEIGRAAGDGLIDRLRTDGFTAPWTGTVPTGAGIWVPTSLPPAGGTLGAVRTYTLTSGSQFRPPPPPVFGTPEFDAAVAEIFTLSTTRTPAQLAQILAWDGTAGTPTPPGIWNSTAAGYVTEHDLDERAAAHTFALMHAAIFDALIGCWDAKYYYWLLRPTQANPAISLAIGLPNHPSYPSGHSCVSAAAGRVLANLFPEHTTEVGQMVVDAGLTRMMAGIHYRFDVLAGQQLGRSVADWTIAHDVP